MNLKENCGDWHLGWGFGGEDKVGKLEYFPDTGVFHWKGHSQGRHGQKWNEGAWVTFKLTDGLVKVIQQEGSHPYHTELVKTANVLMERHLKLKKNV